ncbi:aminotransferase class IV [Marinoscillum sp. 108]|uniref:aminotransferase class IV n=1 Tax=Marinoscillum sp. 108 TaxID=2653151 RepID=UPI0012F31DAC|nr:aminotransferase class IV [Marinoscillum sp. 108]VXD16244.1 Aminotransferase IV [Marinoscillum sp. 108]
MLQKYNPKNEDIKIWVDDRLMDRSEAKVSVFDSSVQGGDAIWEGLRVYKEGVFCLDHHLRRMRESAKALAFESVPSDPTIKSAIKATLQANGMTEDTHIRLTLTRGEKVTSGMDPRLNQKGPCLIVLAEWKPLVYDNEKGIKVITSTQRRNNPQYLDSKIHHANLLNNILAKVQANFANVDAAIMLDHQGFVAELNDTNLFMAKEGVLYTPYADACLHGITRGLVMDLARKLDLPVFEKNLSLVEFYNADEVFATGTMGELTPIHEIDGRKIENKSGQLLRGRLQKAFAELIPTLCEKL